MEGFSISDVPGLRSPIVIIGFTGWSDTGTVTVDAVGQLAEAFNAERFIDVDPEEYFVFTDSRPNVSVDDEGIRELHWPRNEAYYVRLPDARNDLILVVGAEPNLRWRTFSEQLGGAIAAHAPSLVCTLVARPAATPHTRPIPVSGSSADPALAARFGLGRSMYQGPTGIIGVLHDVLRRHGAPLISLAASVPHYLNVEENPPATLALLRALEPVLGFPPPVGDLEEEGVRFLERVNEASRGDDQIGQYVQNLEDHYAEDAAAAPEGGGAELPSADDVLRDVEDFLRGSGGDS